MRTCKAPTAGSNQSIMWLTSRPADGLYKRLDVMGEGGSLFFPHTKKQVQVHGRRGRKELNFPKIMKINQ